MWHDKFDEPAYDIFQIMNEKGEIPEKKKSLMPKMTDEILMKAYELMNFSRIQERMQLDMNKVDGKVMKVINFLPCTGQEATEVGYAIQLKKGLDWFCPAYRNNAAWITAGYPVRNVLRYWLGNELGSQMPEGVNILPINIPIGSQYSHAAGLAFAEKYKKGKGIALTTIGDGGTSEGEFYEAMNFAAIHSLPVVFMIENNCWSLTTPTAKATKSPTFAQKGNAVAIPNMRVDGNDFFAVYKVVEEAIARARSGKGPSLIEAMTYRQLAHSAADIKKDYFKEKDWEIEKEWLTKDPIDRLRNYLMKNKGWTQKHQDELETKIQTEVAAEIKWVLENNDVPLEDIFKYTYSYMPTFLEEQLQEAQDFFSQTK